MVLQFLKRSLIQRGTDNATVRFAASALARLQNARLTFLDDRIEIVRQDRKLILRDSDLSMLRFMIGNFDSYFGLIEPRELGDYSVLDFSLPAAHRYRKEGVVLFATSIPDEGDMDVYTRFYRPQPDDIVLDLGAHMGATTYSLSKMAKTVYAFEPDAENRAALERNIAIHELLNVTVIPAAIAGSTGRRAFSGGGSLASGFAEYVAHPEALSTVASMTLADACKNLGEIPAFVMMDIEGAEAEVIESSRELLRGHSIHFAIECHGAHIRDRLGKAFTDAGYQWRDAVAGDQLYVWAAQR